jgi:hypothetical protein
MRASKRVTTMQMIKQGPLNFRNTDVAYLLAVASASLVFAISTLGFAIISSGGFETVTTNTLSTKVQHLLVMTAALFVIGCFFAFFTAVIPYSLGIIVAKLLDVSHWPFFVIGASVVAIAICPLFVSIPKLGINIQEPETSFYMQCLSILPFFVASGAVAGMTCWRVLRGKSSST